MKLVKHIENKLRNKESAVRVQQPNVTLEALNTLLRNRCLTDTFVDYSITDEKELLSTTIS